VQREHVGPAAADARCTIIVIPSLKSTLVSRLCREQGDGLKKNQPVIGCLRTS
jgi:hypothetical protein